jgi:hypothetical protein
MNVLDIRKILEHQISENPVLWKSSCPIPTDMTKVTVAIRNLRNTAKQRSGQSGFQFPTRNNTA